jgi:tetratricopeptide (TPR) repeat protein
MGQDTEAIAEVQKMPPAVYESALADSGFLSMLGSIYQQANQFDVAQGLLERSVKLQVAAGGQPSVALELQLAAIYLEENQTQKAYGIYRQVLETSPESADAWKGLIAALTVTHREEEALQEIAQIPAPVRKQLDADIEFVQSEASLYAATGDVARAVEYMNRVQTHYAKLHIAMPAAVEIQNAWLLFNTQNDRALYPALMRLGSRTDMTVAQRETVQDIWANWSVRRASAALDNGNLQRSVDILDAASQAFPDNITVRKAVAGGYVQVGRAKESLSLYKTIPMQDATAGDFEGAIGAALSANDKTQAELWLRQALERFPREAAILALAARYEQARGDNERAADYYRASLALMPAASPAEKLAHVLVYPDQDPRAHRAVTAADLQHLLDPNNEPFAKTTKLPPLPAYGADPYNGTAPVQPGQSPPATQVFPEQQGSEAQGAELPPPGELSHGQTQPQPQPQADAPQIYPPSANRGQTPTAPVYIPQAWTIPQRRTPHTQPLRDEQQGMAGDPEGIRYASPHYARPRLVYASPQIDTRHPLRAARYFRTASFAMAAGSPRGVSDTPAQSQQLPPLPADPQAAQLSANPPRSQASDAWKGLVFSLMASNRNAEALDEIAKIPADVRQQLEADVEFVQGEASLYAAVGDIPHATEYLNRVESFYQLRRADVPPALEVQHAWLLFNTNDVRALYPVLQRLDARGDLTAPQREQVKTLWANFAVRRAQYFLNNGNQARALQILEAAAEDYPNNLTVRRAVAGAYAKAGHAADALALFKTIPMDDATPGDYQGAIGAAIAATDMAQAETWLRQALARYPGDPQVLGLAARFEQARGNTARAADFWRASLAAMPPGAASVRLDTQVIAGSLAPPAAGDMKRLLDPRTDPGAKATGAPALPAYGPNNSVSHTPDSMAAPPAGVLPQNLPQSSQWVHPPSSNPLPLPGESTVAATPSREFPTTASATAREPFAPARRKPKHESLHIQQDSVQSAGTTQSARSNQAANPQAVSSVHTGNNVKTPGISPALTPYMGKMNVPPSEETVGSTSSDPNVSAPPSSRPPPAWKTSTSAGAPNPTPSLRISARPMGPVAAEAQALLADQTDGQLTQGSAAVIHNVPNAPINTADAATGSIGRLPSLRPTQPAQNEYNTAQYTPNAQEAATGAYSAPKRQQQQQTQPAQQPTPPAVIPPLSPAPAAQSCTTRVVCPPARHTPRHAPVRRKKPLPQADTPTLGQAPADTAAQPYQEPKQVQAPAETPAPVTAPTTDTGLTDDELQQRNLPPLRGPWVRIQRQANPINPRDEAEMQLHSIEAGYSPWFGGNGIINYRSGSLGFDHLSALEAPFEVSMPLGFNTRLTVIAKPVFLDSGQADGTSTITVQESTTAGTQLVSIPQPIGTLTDTATTIPGQQNAVGIGGEVQLAFPHLAIAGGYTPAGFLVATFTGRAYWKPANGPFTFNFSRDPVRDTQLSYAGLRDPSGDSLGNQGQVWGGVVANQGQVQFAHGDAESGFYIGGGGQYLAGYQVETNTRIDGSGGAYWRLKTIPEYGNLSIGANFFGMHYAHNEDAFTHGMGGYFSPQSYFLANVPFTWVGHYGTRWHYNILGSLGVQAFQEDLTPLWPLTVDKALETALDNAMLPAKTSVGPNYDLRSNVSYQIGSHWFAGGFLGANNSRNYSSVNAGFSIHYMFRVQPSTATGPTGIFPSDGVRPFTVP